jgi:Ca2+-binding RTX toxin-like protein
MDFSAYADFSGSIGDDVLIGLDQDSVLYGGDGGSDRIIGGLGDDILIASMGAMIPDDTFDELTGGAGSDVFAFVKAERLMRVFRTSTTFSLMTLIVARATGFFWLDTTIRMT